VRFTYDAVDGDADPRHEGKGYHGTTIGIPSSVNHGGKRGVAFDNQVGVEVRDEKSGLAFRRLDLLAALRHVMRR
jgi:hypothetical protein